ncbi:hypothetical protein IWZ03DRAFT_365817 [Phyllosticta citriasiana]|uniref:Uncharacterized protein n=1 Tax=Phyllosticta citriasiana TaxID=595635 RepID=A0ABR1KYF2_9PEZI
MSKHFKDGLGLTATLGGYTWMFAHCTFFFFFFFFQTSSRRSCRDGLVPFPSSLAFVCHFDWISGGRRLGSILRIWHVCNVSHTWRRGLRVVWTRRGRRVYCLKQTTRSMAAPLADRRRRGAFLPSGLAGRADIGSSPMPRPGKLGGLFASQGESDAGAIKCNKTN